MEEAFLELFTLSNEARDLAFASAQNLTGKRKPERIEHNPNKEPPAQFFIYDWSEGHQALLDRVINDLTDKLKDWSKVVRTRTSVVTLKQNNSLRTAVGKRSIIIPIGEGIGGRVVIHKEEEERYEKEWRFGTGYILQQSVAIRAIEHDLTMILVHVAPEPQETVESQ